LIRWLQFRAQLVAPESAASAAGLESGDVILAVNGVPTAGKNLLQVVHGIKNSANPTVVCICVGVGVYNLCSRAGDHTGDPEYCQRRACRSAAVPAHTQATATSRH
jgi:hypothetical protein